MRIHTDVLTYRNLDEGLPLAVYVEHRTRHGSRSRDHERAATYDDCRYWLAHLFELDPDAIAGPYKRPRGLPRPDEGGLPMKITGECLCHGTVVSGPPAPAKPRPYYHTELITGLSIKCHGVLDGGLHDVPLTWPTGLDRLTTQDTVVAR